MDDSTTDREGRYDERLRLVFDFLLDLLFLTSLSGVFEAFFFAVLVGTACARLGEKVNARVSAALHNIRFTIRNLLGYGTILMGTKIDF
jgi:Na+/H+-dicarboxylate symporter